MDYSKTLNLPETSFSMKANLTQKEPEYLKKWEEDRIYEKQLDKNKGRKKFILHDGPPYANGNIHLGTALNKVLKDMIVRYKSMNGYYAPYVPGWDTHGLPTEQRAIKELGLKRHETGPIVFRDACRDFAMKYVDLQRQSFKRLGVRGDWEHPYITLTKDYEAVQIKIFGEMAQKGYIYKGLRPVYWCPDCETALAEAEIEYQEDETVSIYVKFRVKDDMGKLGKFTGGSDKVYVVIWTTTAWTLPGNLAISLNPEFEYAVVAVKDGFYVIADELVKNVMAAAGITDYKITGKVKGSELEFVKCQHPFIDRDSIVILGDHVTLDAGTGCVHTAPGFGADDFNVCKKYNMDIIVPVDGKGMQTADAGPVAGMHYSKSNKAVIELLETSGLLLAKERINHQYPHCWRCKNPIIFRTTEQWFVSVNGFRDSALEEVKNVKWLPEWGEERITKMITERNDWCISRQRIWGVPIPIFYCEECGKEYFDKDTIENVSRIFAEKGSNAWYELSAEELMGKKHTCSCGSSKFRKETDIMDVWFDSGSSHAAVLEKRPELGVPADIYLEGSDQHRGWFQSSLLTAVATGRKAPYRQVITHGYVVDGQGRKMSKSTGNGIEPEDILKEFGADILRMWVAASDYKADIRISKDILKQLSEVYRKIRNTARYILGNISDFDPEQDLVPYEDMVELDKWALLRLNGLISKVNAAYDGYEFHTMFHAIHNFCVVDMSNFYLDIIKDRLYTSGKNSQERRSGQTAMYVILDALVKILSPVLVFTCEEIWGNMPHRAQDNIESLQLNDWPVLNELYDNTELEQKWDKIINLKYDVSKVLELARNDKVIGHSLNAEVTIYADGEQYEFLKSVECELQTVFIVSGFKLLPSNKAPETAVDSEYFSSIKISVAPAEGEKCERCWMYSTTVGSVPEHPTICKRCAGKISE
ncbi:MAG: isoleucine--tRNA ligase [Clostridiales bacterium]|jgi:isoleucyl-tRNA synthetase|nr:isoleucine--tRNA ligase [Clostridiales bacterium]